MTYGRRIGSTIGEMCDIEIFVITEGNMAHRELCVVYRKSVLSVGCLSPTPAR